MHMDEEQCSDRFFNQDLSQDISPAFCQKRTSTNMSNIWTRVVQPTKTPLIWVGIGCTTSHFSCHQVDDIW